ncbi:MAG: acyltransferase [Bacteriovorax sp.]
METNQSKAKTEEYDDINARGSSKTGFSAALENVFRKFQTIGFLLCLIPILLVCVFCLAVALTPGLMLLQTVSPHIADYSLLLKSFCYGFVIATGFLGFIITLIFIVPVMNFPVIPFVKPYRGAWFSIESIPWYYHNALTYLVRYTILDLITPSPLNVLFFKMMGMKIGKGVLINTSNISDPCLIVLEDYVTIGGSVFMMAHYGMKGFLIIDKLHIKKGAMIGLAAKLLGGVTIGEKAVVGPNVAVLPKTIIKPGEKYGVPVNTAVPTAT